MQITNHTLDTADGPMRLYEVVHEDNASGAKGADQRPGLARMLLSAPVTAAAKAFVDRGDRRRARRGGTPDAERAEPKPRPTLPLRTRVAH